jgi:hypothetical protein
MMMLWNLDVAPYMVDHSWNGFYDGSSGSWEETPEEQPKTAEAKQTGYGYDRQGRRRRLAAVNESDIPIEDYGPADGDCAANNTCATEDCLLRWFSGHISSIAPDYDAFFDACKPDFCDVVIKKSLVTKVVSFLSTLGGLWGPLYMGALMLWLLLARLPCLTATGGAHAADVEMVSK